LSGEEKFFTRSLFFYGRLPDLIKENIPEKIAYKEKGEDEEWNEKWWKIEQGKSEDKNSPQESDPQERIFFIYFPMKIEFEKASQESKDEGKRKKEKEKFR
jgi:hypothetical protein